MSERHVFDAACPICTRALEGYIGALRRTAASEERKISRCPGCGSWRYMDRACPVCAKAGDGK